MRGRGLASRRAAGTRVPMKSETSFFHARWLPCSQKRRVVCAAACSAPNSTSTTMPSGGRMQVASPAGQGLFQVTERLSHLTFSIQATALGTAPSTSHHVLTSTLPLHQRLMGNYSLLQRLTGNPNINPHPFSYSAPLAPSSPSGAEQAHVPPPLSPAPATPCPSPHLSVPRLPSRSRRCHRSTATGPAGGAGTASSPSDGAEGGAPGWKPHKPRPF